MVTAPTTVTARDESRTHFPSIRTVPDTREKLSILSQDSQYDLACACGTRDSDRRRRSEDDRWIYPVVLPNRSRVVLLKTLISNACVYDCRYCPLRVGQDTRRCTLEPDALVKTFLEYYRTGKVMGLFLSSGVTRDPDTTMNRINSTAAILRRTGFKGYIHLKIIPGASDGAVEEAVSLASAVSVNIETPGEARFRKLGASKNYLEDVIRPMKTVSRLTAKGSRYSRVKQTTQFVVGASDETDQEIIKYSWGLYRRVGLSRVYFSAYQRGLGESDLPGETSSVTNDEMLTREHRLYQVDWLFRKYGFTESEIPLELDGSLSLLTDPKEVWAIRHPEFFPIDVNTAGKFRLLRVPGFGPVTVNTILGLRKNGGRIRSIGQLGRPGKRLKKAEKYLKFGY
jgi:predicted DNA-binding helix-hairpin-helix protein